jgi:hypothetical protein
MVPTCLHASQKTALGHGPGVDKRDKDWVDGVREPTRWRSEAEREVCRSLLREQTV